MKPSSPILSVFHFIEYNAYSDKDYSTYHDNDPCFSHSPKLAEKTDKDRDASNQEHSAPEHPRGYFGCTPSFESPVSQLEWMPAIFARFITLWILPSARRTSYAHHRGQWYSWEKALSPDEGMSEASGNGEESKAHFTD